MHSAKKPFCSSEPCSSITKKVLFAICNLDRGGTEIQTVELAKRLHASHYCVTVAALQGKGPLRTALQEAGIRIVDFPKKGGLVSARGAYQFLRLVRFIRRERFGVVHSHDLWANLVAVPAAKLAGAPLVLSSQRDLAHLYWYTPSRNKVISRIHRWSDGVVVNSSAVSDLVQKQFLVPAERIHLLYNGIDFERFSRAQAHREKLLPMVARDAPLILTVANMHSAVKGHFDLIEAAKILRASYPQAKFIFAGDGEHRPRFENSVKDSGVQDSVIFLGQREDIPELLCCCDVFVLASHAEGLPNSILEAMAAGRPVVATAVGGIPEVIEDRRNGLLVPPRDPVSLADALLKILKDRDFGTRLGLAGHEHARSQFSFDSAVAKLKSIYELQFNRA